MSFPLQSETDNDVLLYIVVYMIFTPECFTFKNTISIWYDNKYDTQYQYKDRN